MSQQQPYLKIVGSSSGIGGGSGPSHVLADLTRALSESHNLNLTRTSAQICTIIQSLHDEVREKGLGEAEFYTAIEFIIKVLKSDKDTLCEFLSYAEFDDE